MKCPPDVISLLGTFGPYPHTFFCQCPRPFPSIVFATLVLKEEEIKLWPLTVKATGWFQKDVGNLRQGA